jgi:hypothetical protein
MLPLLSRIVLGVGVVVRGDAFRLRVVHKHHSCTTTTTTPRHRCKSDQTAIVLSPNPLSSLVEGSKVTNSMAGWLVRTATLHPKHVCGRIIDVNADMALLDDRACHKSVRRGTSYHNATVIRNLVAAERDETVETSLESQSGQALRIPHHITSHHIISTSTLCVNISKANHSDANADTVH